MVITIITIKTALIIIIVMAALASCVRPPLLTEWSIGGRGGTVYLRVTTVVVREVVVVVIGVVDISTNVVFGSGVLLVDVVKLSNFFKCFSSFLMVWLKMPMNGTTFKVVLRIGTIPTLTTVTVNVNKN